MYNYSNYGQNMQSVCNQLKQFESLQNVSLAQQRIQNDPNFPKSCYNCKHKRYGYHNVTDGPCDRWGGIVSYEYARSCILNGYLFWESDVATDAERSDSGKNVSTELSQCETHEEMLQIARKHGLAIDLTKQESQDKPVTFIDFRENLDNTPLRDLGVRKVYETEQGKTVVIEDKPKKKYTVYDMYDLVFPDDPIKAHFDAERKKINEEYEKQKAVVDKLEVPEVRINRPEPIPTVTYYDNQEYVMCFVMLIVGLIYVVLTSFF